MTFLENADTYLKMFWYIALPVSLVFLIQSAITILGLSADHDTDVHDIDAPLQIFTIRNLINFLLGFGWGGIAFYHTIDNKFLLILAALACGFAFVAFFFYIIQQIKKLDQDNTPSPEMYIGLNAKVYLRIPESGDGLIQVSYKGSVKELNAISVDGSIETGAEVIITGFNEDNQFIVQKLKI
ncbi:MAG: NfeD family protein [Saprospiraceae bacterium]|nr:NfeD family protein [Saprospiraceae bacterium]